MYVYVCMDERVSGQGDRNEKRDVKEEERKENGRQRCFCVRAGV